MPDGVKQKIEIVQATPEPEIKTPAWTSYETTGVGIINGVLLLPKEERERKIAEMRAAYQEFMEHGKPAVPGAPYICPNGCVGPFRTFGKMTTLLGWAQGLDPNHWTEECLCEACGARFTKEWVWAKNYGRPWYSVYEGGKRICYHGEPTCCEECYIMREPK
jgi:hypothetical protein